MTDPRHAQAQLALQLSRNMQRMMQGHTDRATRITQQVVQHGIATGFVDLAGPGESTVEIAFPQIFAEKPVFTFGFELGPSSWIETGDFPVGTAVVTRWQNRQLNDMPTWVGAKLAVVLVGIKGPAVLHYDFKAKALATPTGTS